MQIQTVFRAGNSNVVAIPKDIARELNIKTGEKVVVEKTASNELVIRKVSRKSKVVSQVEEFKRWWSAFLKENAEILDELAVR